MGIWLKAAKSVLNLLKLFGFNLYSDDIPKNGTIVDNGSRETLAIIADGEVITDPEEIEQYTEDEIDD